MGWGGGGGLAPPLYPPLRHETRYQMQDKSASAMHYYEPIAREQAIFMYLRNGTRGFTN